MKTSKAKIWKGVATVLPAAGTAYGLRYEPYQDRARERHRRFVEREREEAKRRGEARRERRGG